MRLNKYIASATGMSRRAADEAIQQNRVRLNGQLPALGQQASATDTVTLDGAPLALPGEATTIMLNKPAGYVCSRDGQGSKTVYDLLPASLHVLKPVGRLDKDSSGLLLLTTDGELAHRLTHPSFQKLKTYEVTLDAPLQPLHHQMVNDIGVQLEDGRSQLQLERVRDGDDRQWIARMHEGRNRQIRRTFDSLGYSVTRLYRTQFGEYRLDDLPGGQYKRIT